MGLRKFKRGHFVSEEVIKWILYLAIVVAVGVAVRTIVLSFAG